MRIGILGTADIAFRRFLPALQKCADFTYVGVATRTLEKGSSFQEAFGGKVYDGYDSLLADQSIEAVYVPLPPALHYEWGRKVLEAGKHLFMEKPFTTGLAETEALLALAGEKGLAVHENYMFLYHSQLAKIKELIASGQLGKIRLLRMAFGFPKRAADDFRYKRDLGGGGALLDCGGYPVRLALELLGERVQVMQARLVQPEGYEVDLYGSAVLEDAGGLCAQISFGMDNAYQCQLEVWGSEATLIAPRIFTAGADFSPHIILRTSSGETRRELEPDDQFLHSITAFIKAIKFSEFRKNRCSDISTQAMLQDRISVLGVHYESHGIIDSGRQAD